MDRAWHRRQLGRRLAIGGGAAALAGLATALVGAEARSEPMVITGLFAGVGGALVFQYGAGPSLVLGLTDLTRAVDEATGVPRSRNTVGATWALWYFVGTIPVLVVDAQVWRQELGVLDQSGKLGSVPGSPTGLYVAIGARW